MTATQAEETVRAQWIRCSPEDFGRFVDGLHELTADQRADAVHAGTRYERERVEHWRELVAPDSTRLRSELEAAERRLADEEESIRQRLLPEWSCSVDRRHITVRGLWADVRDQIPLREAKNLRVTIGSSSRPPRIDVAVYNRGLDVAFTASSGEWLDRNLPGVESQLKRLGPKWRWIPRRAINTFVLITAVPFLALSIAQSFIGQAWLTYTVGAVTIPFWAFLIITWIPAVRFGSARQRWWSRGGQWLILAVLSGLIGAFIAKLLGW